MRRICWRFCKCFRMPAKTKRVPQPKNERSFYAIARHADIKNEYGFFPAIGSGATAVVYKAVNKKKKETCAIKMLTKSSMKPYDIALLKREVGMVKELRHDNIVRVYDFLEDYFYYYVVMEFVQGGDLHERIKHGGKLNEECARPLVYNLLNGLEFLHNHDIVHRDIKPSNLLLYSDDCLKIADFGFCAHVHGDYNSLTDQCGTIFYMAPEIIEKKMYGKAVDMWSTGIVVYVMLTGQLPFFHKKAVRLENMIVRGIFDIPSHVAMIAMDLIKHLLVRIPSNRLTASHALCHPWFFVNDDARSRHLYKKTKSGMYLLFSGRKTETVHVNNNG